MRVRLLRKSFRHAVLSLSARPLLRTVHGGNAIGAADAYDVLRVRAHAQLGGGEEAIDDVVVAADPIVDELVVAVGADDEERWRFALIDPCRKLDIDFRAVIEGAQRTPRWAVARDRIAKLDSLDSDAGRERRSFISLCILALQREQAILRIGPGDRRHRRSLGAFEMKMIDCAGRWR